jgi:hypothetical protein
VINTIAIVVAIVAAPFLLVHGVGHDNRLSPPLSTSSPLPPHQIVIVIAAAAAIAIAIAATPCRRRHHRRRQS